MNSLEEVLRHFLSTASNRAEEAQRSAEASLEAIEDLEADASPEDLMLSYVTEEGNAGASRLRGGGLGGPLCLAEGEAGGSFLTSCCVLNAERTDRELVAPWFKFLWEAYRSCLEILRNNAKLEKLYAMVASRAFGFCIHYRRTTEFRRLCDMLRTHMSQLQREQPTAVIKGRERPDLALPETLSLFMETRFEQLRVACRLEMWQEAFRSVEDIHSIITTAKRMPPPRLMAQYYGEPAPRTLGCFPQLVPRDGRAMGIAPDSSAPCRAAGGDLPAGGQPPVPRLRPDPHGHHGPS